MAAVLIKVKPSPVVHGWLHKIGKKARVFVVWSGELKWMRIV
jgi:hypothetical protein